MARSSKPPVIERIFFSLWDSEREELRRSVVTMADVVEAIQWANQETGSSLSTRNPANFVKDVIRGTGASRMWPESLKARRWTARQVTGDGNCFEFVRYAEGQTEPFPNHFKFSETTKRHQLQSLSMPLATKELGRDDETYLIQVAVKLAVVETHFALESPLEVLELNHLQVSIKLRLCEVDSLFAATLLDEEDGKQKRVVITAEAKKKNQRIIPEQVVQQVKAAFGETNSELVIPIAMTAVATGDARGIYVAEFKAVRRRELAEFDSLELSSDAFYEFVPPVRGI